MGITPVGSEWGNSETTANATLVLPAHSVTAGNDVIVAVVGAKATAPTACTPSDDKGNTYTLIDGVTNGPIRVELWRATIASGKDGSITITITPSVTVGVAASCWEFNSMDSSSSVDVHVTASGSSVSPTATTATTSAGNELVFALVGTRSGIQVYSSQTFTPSTSPTIGSTWLTTGNTCSLQSAFEVEGSSTGTQQYAATLGTSVPWGCIIATFKAAVSGGTTYTRTGSETMAAVSDSASKASYNQFTGSETMAAVSDSTAINGLIPLTLYPTNYEDSILINSYTLESSSYPRIGATHGTTIDATAAPFWTRVDSGGTGNTNTFATEQNPDGVGAYVTPTPLFNLNGFQIQAGIWTFNDKLHIANGGTLTADLHWRVWKYNATGPTYTLICEAVLAAQSIPTIATAFTGSVSANAMTFGVNDQIYTQLDAYVTATSGTVVGSLFDTATFNGDNVSIVTPGYLAMSQRPRSPSETLSTISESPIVGGSFPLSFYPTSMSSGDATLTATNLMPVKPTKIFTQQASKVGTTVVPYARQLWSQGDANIDTLPNSNPPDGHGWLTESSVFSFDGYHVVSGTWTFNSHLHVSTSGASCVADIWWRVYAYNGGVYTPIIASVLPGQTIVATAGAGNLDFTHTDSSGPLYYFANGDQLYLDVWLQVTSTTNFVASATNLTIAVDTQDVATSFTLPGLQKTIKISRTPSEILSALSDVATSLAAGGHRTATETLATVGDTATRSASSLVRTGSETFSTLSETAARGAQSFHRSISESLAAVSDSLTRTLTLAGRIPNETLSAVNDSATRYKIIGRSATETLSAVSDSATRAAQTLGRTGSEAMVVVGDNVSRTLVLVGRTASEALSAVSDSAFGQKQLGRFATETLSTISEGVSRVQSLVRTSLETFSTIADVSHSATIHSRSASEVLTAVSDLARRTMSWARTGTETLAAISDTAGGSHVLGRVATEVLELINEATASRVLTLARRTPSETLAVLSDVTTRFSIVTRTAVEYLATSGANPTIKPGCIGFYDRQGIPAGKTWSNWTNAAYNAGLNGFVMTGNAQNGGIAWSELQANDPSNTGTVAISGSYIDQAFTQARDYNTNNPGNSQWVLKLRIWGGEYAPDWAKKLGDTNTPQAALSYTDSGNIVHTIGRWWDTDYLTVWENFMTTLANYVPINTITGQPDPGGPLKDNPLLGEVTINMTGDVGAEPLLYSGWDTTGLSALQAAKPTAFTYALHKTAVQAAIDNMGDFWSTTPFSFAFNPATDFDGTGGSDETFTEAMIDELVKAGPPPQGVLENNSLRSQGINVGDGINYQLVYPNPSTGKGYIDPHDKTTAANYSVMYTKMALYGQGQAAYDLRGGSGGTTIKPFDCVVVVIMENRGYTIVWGTANTPFLTNLGTHNAYSQKYFSGQDSTFIGPKSNGPSIHPSRPNYIVLLGGDYYNVNDDTKTGTYKTTTAWSVPLPSSITSLVDLLEAKGITWAGYMEDMPGSTPTQQENNSGNYAERHNPFSQFQSIMSGNSTFGGTRASRVVPYSQFNVSKIGTGAGQNRFVWITPNTTNDMHTGSTAAAAVTAGDTFLGGNVWPGLSTALVPQILASPAFGAGTNSLLIVVFDEGDNPSTTSQTALVFAGTAALAGAASTVTYNHYDLLKTIQAGFGITNYIGKTAPSSVALMTDMVQTVSGGGGGPIASPSPITIQTSTLSKMESSSTGASAADLTNTLNYATWLGARMIELPQGYTLLPLSTFTDRSSMSYYSKMVANNPTVSGGGGPVTVIDDEATGFRGFARTASEILSGIADSARRATQQFIRVPSETLPTIMDTTGRVFLVTASELLQLPIDVARHTVNLVRSAPETLQTIVDIALGSGLHLMERIATEVLMPISDSASRLKMATRTAIEIFLPLQDTVSGILTHAGLLFPVIHKFSDQVRRFVLKAQKRPFVLKDQVRPFKVVGRLINMSLIDTQPARVETNTLEKYPMTFDATNTVTALGGSGLANVSQHMFNASNGQDVTTDGLVGSVGSGGYQIQVQLNGPNLQAGQNYKVIVVYDVKSGNTFLGTLSMVCVAEVKF